MSAAPLPGRPLPPYYAVIITSAPSGIDLEGYAEMGRRMGELARRHPGFLHRESMVDETGRDLLVVYYETAESVAAWKADVEHLEAQRLGKEKWYAEYTVEVARVERAYAFKREA